MTGVITAILAITVIIVYLVLLCKYGFDLEFAILSFLQVIILVLIFVFTVRA